MLKQPDYRCQYEAEQHRQCYGHKDLARKIQCRDNNRDDHEVIEGQAGRDNHILLPR
jgi:hypothetical protein